MCSTGKGSTFAAYNACGSEDGPGHVSCLRGSLEKHYVIIVLDCHAPPAKPTLHWGQTDVLVFS